MRTMQKKIKAGAATAFLLSLAACGGGGGGGSAPLVGIDAGTAAPPAASPSKLGGIAATGAPFAGASITVIDQTGATVCTTQTDAKGAYACELPTSTKAPLVITASRDDLTLYSTTASTTGGTANVTPLTTVIVSRLAPDGNPASLAGAIHTTPDAVTDATVKRQVSALIEALRPLLSALGDTIDPIGGSFAADGSGHDRVLDSISVSVRPDGAAANIEITVKAVPTGEGSKPLAISFRSNEPVPATLPAISVDNVVPAGVSQSVAAFLTRLNACYALPLSQRVNAPNDTSAAVGGPADVIAPACRTLFLNDDPATFLSNGNKVGRSSNGSGAFASFFRPGATGLMNDRGNFEFFRSNGDLVLSYRWTDTFGNTDNDTFAVRNVGGVLKLTGNGYAYNARVAPIVLDRDFLNTPAFSYFSTGYNISIANQRDSNNAPIFSKVIATTPLGTTIEYIPSTLSFLVASNGGTPTSSSAVRLAGAYKDPATPGNPADKEPQIYFVPQQYTEAQLRSLPDQSVWKLEFVHADGNTPNVVQYYRTLSRAPTLAETRQLTFADVTPALRAGIVTQTSASGNFAFGAPSRTAPNLIDFSADGNQDGWTVPAGALAPTAFIAYGRAPRVNQTPGPRFNDSLAIRNTARKAILTCAPQGQNDTHCDNSTGVLQYAAGSTVNTFELWARSPRQVEVSKLLALYKIQ